MGPRTKPSSDRTAAYHCFDGTKVAKAESDKPEWDGEVGSSSGGAGLGSGERFFRGMYLGVTHFSVSNFFESGLQEDLNFVEPGSAHARVRPAKARQALAALVAIPRPAKSGVVYLIDRANRDCTGSPVRPHDQKP